MLIERSKPFARGVSDLMYVGDVPTPIPSPSLSSAIGSMGSVVPVAALGYWAYKSKGGKRLVLAGAAAYFALKAGLVPIGNL